MFANYSQIYKKDEMKFTSAKMEALVAEAYLTDVVRTSLPDQLKTLVLYNACKLIFNLVPDNGEKDLSKQFATVLYASNYLQPNDLLGGHSIIEFILNNTVVMSNMLKYALARNRKTLFGKLMEGTPNLYLILRYMNNFLDLLYEPDDITFDFNMQTAIHACLGFEKPTGMLGQVTIFLQNIFANPASQHNHMVLTSLFETII